MFIKHKRIFVLQLLILFVFLILSCRDKEKSKNDTGSIKNNLLTDTFSLEKQKVFRHWLMDTIAKLNTSIVSQERGAGLVAKDFIVMPDSLGLAINLYYDLVIGLTKNTNNESNPGKLLSLLNEYDEHPKLDSRLKFTVNNFYSLSPVSELTYDLIVDFKNIQINSLDDKIVSKYTYIRGRISDKTITWLDKNKIQRNEHIDFIWEGNKLIKRKL